MTSSTTSDAWVEACGADELGEGEARNAAGVTLVKLDGRIHACGSRCPHMGYPMNKGTLRDGVITCAWHKWEFDLDSGGCLRGACDDLPIYPVEIRDGTIYVRRERDPDAAALAQRRLREGLMMGDVYLQAKAVAALLGAGCTQTEVTAIGLDQAFAHSLGAHQSLQALVESQAVLDAGELAECVGGKQRVAVLLQGLRQAGGRVGERPAVLPLPEPWHEARLLDLLEAYVDDPSALGVERILLSLGEVGTEPATVEARLYELATSPLFIHHREVFAGLVHAQRLGDLLATTPQVAEHELVPAGHLRAALSAWLIGAMRREPDPDERDAMRWLEAHVDQLDRLELVEEGEAITADAIAELCHVQRPEAALERMRDWVAAGVGFRQLLDALSLFCARRLARLWLNNGGMWADAIEGLRSCDALRLAAERVDGRFRVRALMQLAFACFESRWLQEGKPWAQPDNAIDGCETYRTAFTALDNERARAAATALLAEDRDALGAFLAPLLDEDLGAAQLATINAALREQARQDEWQPYIAGLVTYVLDGKSPQDLRAAARFGRSFAAGE